MDENLLLQIESYLADELSQEEKQLFEEKMKADPDLLKEVLLAKQINLHLSGNVDQENLKDNTFTSQIREKLKEEDSKKLKNKIREIKKEHHKELKKKNNQKRLFLIAASISLFLIAATSLYLFNNPTSKELFATYYNREDLSTVIKRGENQNTYEQGVIAFNNKEYHKAITLFNNYINTKEFNSSVYNYLGVAYWEINENSKALQAFDKMILSNSIDSPKGLWFKAMLYLKINDIENAKKTLLLLVKDSSKYKHTEALEILKRLE